VASRLTGTTLGIDLSSNPARTAACLISWGEDGNRVERLATGDRGDALLENEDLLEMIRAADLTGIDAPFGWPVPFVEAVRSWDGFSGWPGSATVAELRYRLTDLRIRRPRLPLSVSSDLIGVTAMRCAAILDSLGDSVDRSGMSGPAIEVYPAAALFRWRLPAEGYKGRARSEVRRQLVAGLCGRLEGVCEVSTAQREACESSDDALDALVASLAVRARMLGRTQVPEAGEETARARVEGWIHVPDCELAELVG
jgi:predicted nuclease with RNAse H fold